jgi:hypothetical protein
MIRLTLLILCIALATKPISAQYVFDWTRTYGGDAWDEAFGMVEDSIGHIFLSGYTKANEKHLWVLKVLPNGNTIWGKTYKSSPETEGRDILLTSDGSIVIAGSSIKPFGYSSDFWLLKLKPDGEKLWEKNYGGDFDESARALTATSDGGFVLVGLTTAYADRGEEAWIVKVDSIGNMLWQQAFGGKQNDFANDVIETSDKGILVCGMTSSKPGGGNAFWVLKLDSAGQYLWENVYPVNKWDQATSVTQGLDGYIYVTGFTRTVSIIDYDVVLLKLDLDGKLIWQKTISWGRWDQATTICTTFDNGIAVGGFTRSGQVLSSDFAATKFDENGQIIWQDIFVKNSLEYPNKIIETRDNGLALAGTTYTQGRGWDYALLKYKNKDLPEILFKHDSVSTSTSEKFQIKSCIKTKSNLKNIQLYFNRELMIDGFKKEKQAEVNCDIPFDAELKLTKGVNIIEIVLTDFKNHQTRKNLRVYFIPPSEEHW